MVPWGPNLYYFLLGDNFCIDAMDGETLQQETTHKGRKNSQLQDLQRQEGGGECVWNIIEQIQVTTGHHGAKFKGCQRHCFYMCGVAQQC